MRYLALIPTALLLTACTSSYTLKEIRADEDRMTIRHTMRPGELARCARDGIAMGDSPRLAASDPMVIQNEGAYSVIGRSSAGIAYVVDLSETAAEISVNPGVLPETSMRNAVAEKVRACASG